jgi:hypothetical protein
VNIWRFDWWKSISKVSVEWEYKWAKDYVANGFSPSEADGVLEEMEGSMANWAELLKNFPKHALVKDLRAWKKKMHDRIKDLRGELDKAIL